MMRLRESFKSWRVDMTSANTRPCSVSEATAQLLQQFAWNPWFQEIYWPENAPRILSMVAAAEKLPGQLPRRTLEIGCGNGYVAALFRILGDDVTAVDAYEDPQRTEMFSRLGIAYQQTNLNDAHPLSSFASDSLDLILAGEVFEHILNTPMGLLQSCFRLLTPGGQLLLTTPNPSTVANALRLLQDRNATWGTQAFLRDTKLLEGRVIDRGDIHYHEYPAWMVRDLLIEVGFDCSQPYYLTAGLAGNQPWWKRGVKQILMTTGLTRMRLFGSGYLLVARKPAG